MRNKDNFKTFIFVTFSKEGIHKYPSAPDEVSFLRFPHRHMFHFNVEISVTHNDREIEFILFKRYLESLYNEKVLILDFKSCEMIATDLINTLLSQDLYKGRKITVKVSEDNENGATVIFDGLS